MYIVMLLQFNWWLRALPVTSAMNQSHAAWGYLCLLTSASVTNGDVAKVSGRGGGRVGSRI